MITRRRFLGLLGGGAVLAAGSGLGLAVLPSEEQGSGYPLIHYGQESCAFCGMGIDDARFASAWRAGRAERHFDDIGCMVSAFHREHPEAGALFFVHDYRSESWLDAETAAYVVSPSIRTPMAFGVAAVADASAVASLGVNADPRPWADLLVSLVRRN